MGDRVSFSQQEQSLESIAAYYVDCEAGLYEFFAGSSRLLISRYSAERVDDARDRALVELDLSACSLVLSAVEAAIRVDYLTRVYNRLKDPLSREMRTLHRAKKNHARLDDDLIRLWRDAAGVNKQSCGQLVSSLNLRHWLAHGRYWKVQLGRKYDFSTVYQVAESFLDEMNAYSVAYM